MSSTIQKLFLIILRFSGIIDVNAVKNGKGERKMSNLGNKEVMANNIQYYLERKGKTRSQLCDAIDVPYTTMANWVQGKTYPRIDKIEKMANFFGVTKADLVEERSGNADLYEMIMTLPEDKAELVRALVEKLKG